MDKIYNEMLKKIDKAQIYLNEPMSKHTSFKIGGPADIFVKVNNITELKYAIEVARANNLPLNIIGNGTNLLVRDGGIRGVVLKLNFKDINFLADDKVEVGSGVLISKISNEACNKELSGLEFAVGIPGTVGGAIKMNAGAYGSEMKDIVISTTYIDKNLDLHTINTNEHDFEYRHSIFSKNKNDIIISSILQLKKDNKKEIQNRMNKNMKSRKEKQPINFPSAGSTFKRGDGYITAQLIDKCRLKGYNVGDACVSDLHAGFIINKGNAKAKDVIKLIDIVKEKVHNEFGINIELEIEILGED